jgi:hypothetical protein
MKNKANCSLWGKRTGFIGCWRNAKIAHVHECAHTLPCVASRCLILPRCDVDSLVQNNVTLWSRNLVLMSIEMQATGSLWAKLCMNLILLWRNSQLEYQKTFFYYHMKCCPLYNGKEMKYKWLKQQLVTCYAFSITWGRFLNAYYQSHSLWYGYLYTFDLLWT